MVMPPVCIPMAERRRTSRSSASHPPCAQHPLWECTTYPCAKASDRFPQASCARFRGKALHYTLVEVWRCGLLSSLLAHYEFLTDAVHRLLCGAEETCLFGMRPGRNK